MIEKHLQNAFDQQHFTENRRLRKVIDSVHDRMEGTELEDDDLDLISAAGATDIQSITDLQKAQKRLEGKIR